MVNNQDVPYNDVTFVLHIVFTGFLSGVESFYHKRATVLE
jgi:hypothetical protein